MGGIILVQSEEKPGFYRGRHFSAYVEDVKSLMRENKLEEAEILLLALINATESDSEYGVAPWYYEKLAILYRKKKDTNAEIEILERFARQNHGYPGSAKPPKLLARLEKLTGVTRSSIKAETKAPPPYIGLPDAKLNDLYS